MNKFDKTYIKIFESVFLIFFIGGLFYNILLQIRDIQTNFPTQDIYPMLDIFKAIFDSLGYFIVSLPIITLGYIFLRLLKKVFTSNLFINFFISIFSFILIVLYISGMYLLWSSDKYSSKQLIAGLILPPYTIYIGGEDIYTRSTIQESIKVKASSQQSNNIKLEQYAKNLNKDLPKMINEGTLALSVKTEGSQIEFTSKLINIDSNISPTKAIIDSVSKKLEKEYCEGAYSSFEKAGISMSFWYVDKNDKVIDGFKFSPGCIKKQAR